MFTAIPTGRALKALALALVTAGSLAVGNPACAEKNPPLTRDVLRQAMLYQIQFRTGHMEIIPDYVSMLEQATLADPDNANLSYQMAVAYFAKAASVAKTGGTMADAAPAYQKGSAALEHTLQLNPDHAEAIALRSGTRLVMAAFAKNPDMVAKLQSSAAAEMNRAIEIKPDSKRARLQRAFSGLTLPDNLRNHVTEAEDLDWLIRVAGNTQSGDYIKLMRGDLHFELGEAKQASILYAAVSRSHSPAAVDAKARLMSLQHGGVPTSDIKALRAAAGSDCVMCHGK